MRAALPRFAVAALVTAAGIIPAGAAEVCVVCAEPSAVYRCMVDVDKMNFKGSDKVLQYLCVTELAKAGKHGSCKYAQGTGPACLGEQRTVGLQGVEGMPQPGSPEAAERDAQRAEAAKNAPPKTLVELAKRTKDQVGEDAKATGEAVGGAMKKTWNCLTSLFSKC